MPEPARPYCGRILHGDFSTPLQARVREHIERFDAFDAVGTPAILYMAAWQVERRAIWYEYAGRRLQKLLGCPPAEAANAFRAGVLHRRIYRSVEPEAGIRREVKSREELDGARALLREEGRRIGTTEAVYKVAVHGGRTVWLKDQAVIESFDADGICLSPGLLTVVSKEMEAEEALKRHHDLLEETVQERTAELTRLNRQLTTEVGERRDAEARLQESHGRLERLVDDVVKAMSLTVEERDPYTAGHQRRTAALATALAREMGLAETDVEGVRMAGLIHDIGKISVPAEILSKPGRLNDAEMLLIRRHPAVAYEILKQIDFPWPVDRIVYQHHERIDGSGYPLGISGDAILLQARILCVADVVETIESHRPYRPGLGRDRALMEIAAHSGTLYDPAVVDACLHLFRNRGFDYT
jgi:putative nucleotidyltransferase with HDIG domain